MKFNNSRVNSKKMFKFASLILLSAVLSGYIPSNYDAKIISNAQELGEEAISVSSFTQNIKTDISNSTKIIYKISGNNIYDKKYSIKIFKNNVDVTNDFVNTNSQRYFAGQEEFGFMTYTLKLNSSMLSKNGEYEVKLVLDGNDVSIKHNNFYISNNTVSENKGSFTNGSASTTPTTVNNGLDGLKPIGTMTGGDTTNPSLDDLFNKKSLDSVEGAKSVYSSSDNEIMFKIYGRNLDRGDIRINLLKDGSIVDGSDYKISKNSYGFDVVYNDGENTTSNDINYTIYVSSQKVGKSLNSSVIKKGSKTLTVNSKVTSFKTNNSRLPLSGGISSFTVKGENLNSDNIKLKIYRGNVDVSGSISIDHVFANEDRLGSFQIHFPKSSGDKDSYRVVLLNGGKEYSSINVTLSKGGSTKKVESFVPKSVYISNNNEITMESDSKIFETEDGILNDNIFIDKNGDGVLIPLTGEDKVTISGNKLVIKFKDDSVVSTLSKNPKLVINERVLKGESGNPLAAVNYIINKDRAIVTSVRYLNGEVLESRGGEVKIEVSGVNLKSDKNGSVVEVVKNTKLKGNSSVKLDTNVSVVGNDKKQVITLILPKNTTNNTQSYSIMLSVDGGKTFKNSFEGGKDARYMYLVSSVLPKGKSLTDTTLSFMSIQSYGTNIGELDNTHTSTPTNQDSKKTMVTLYGTNLHKSITKVRIVDANGVIWIPVNEPSKNSLDRFTMVGFDGSGIDGNGNVQRIEVIAPKEYRKDGDLENTYTYQVAVDGINFNKDITVSVTVLDDGLGERQTLKSLLKDVVLNYETEEGKKIIPSKTVKLMKNHQLYITEATPINIDGYEYKTIKGYIKSDRRKNIEEEYNRLLKKDNLSKDEENTLNSYKNMMKDLQREELKEIVGDRSDITFIYKKTSTTDDDEGKPSKDDANVNKEKDNEVDKTPTSGVDEGKPSKDDANVNKEKDNEVEKTSTSGVDEGKSSISYIRSHKRRHSGYKNYGPVINSGNSVLDNALGTMVNKESGVFNTDSKTGYNIGLNNREGYKKKVPKKGNYDVLRSVLNTKSYLKHKKFKNIKSYLDEFRKKGKSVKRVILVDSNNIYDVLSISAYSSKEGLPIVFVDKNKLDKDGLKFIKDLGIKDALIIGGNKSVSTKLEKMFKRVDRISGKDRYETNKKVYAKLIANGSSIKKNDINKSNYKNKIYNGKNVIEVKINNERDMLKVIEKYNDKIILLKK